MCHADSNIRASGRALLLTCTTALLLGSPAVRADDAPNLLEDRFQLSLGTFGVNNEPRVDLRGETGGGGTLDVGRSVSGNEVNPRFDGQWRFAERHKVRLSAFSYSRSNTKVLDEEIEWGDETFPVNAELEVDNGWTVIAAAYEYSFLRRENYEIGASIGLHYFDFDVDLRAEGDASGEPFERVLDESASIGLPAPVIGLRGLVSLTHDLWLDASAQFFALSLDEYDGNLQDYRVFVTWQPKKWVGIGAGYNRFKVDVDVEKSSFNGNLDWTYDGPMLFYSVSF